jgi:hypothetical protein
VEAQTKQVLENISLSIRSVFQEEEDMVPNVVAMVRGADPELSQTYVVLTAHFDHVGVGPPDETGDSIYNGADDNASGTSALLQVAAAFAALPEPPARSVIFLAVSGEEKGLLGSRYWVDHPTVPLDGVVANVNMDMVGRNDPDTVYVIGDEYTDMGEWTRQIAAENPQLRLVTAPDPDPEEQVFLRSDQFSFVERGIPAIFFTTWLHDDYHAPSDTPEKIDADKIARVSRLAFLLTYRVATDPTPPEWTPAGRQVLQGLSMLDQWRCAATDDCSARMAAAATAGASNTPAVTVSSLPSSSSSVSSNVPVRLRSVTELNVIEPLVTW